MTSVVELLSMDNPVFRAYGFWASVMIMKVLVMAALTSRIKRKKNFVINAEDAKMSGKTATKFDARDPDVERVQRAHQNDLENCIPFLIISFIYMLTNPSVFIATMILRIGVISRIIFTVSYLNELQPFRSISFAVCLLSMVFMSINNIRYFM